MGSVFRATQLGLGRAVAVKVIRPDHAWSPWYRARFEREARVMAALDHHNAVKILDYGAEPGFSWLAMELLVGETLAAWLARGPLAEVTAARIGAAVADVLVTAHAMRLVHRDLKPENLFILDGEGPPDPERVRVVDFGIAFIEDAGDMGRLTRGDVVVGTPAYISPEVLTRRVVGPPADLYALGVILFEMVTGTTPFVGDAGQLQARQIYLAPPSIAATRGSAVDPRYQDLRPRDPHHPARDRRRRRRHRRPRALRARPAPGRLAGRDGPHGRRRHDDDDDTDAAPALPRAPR
jgi:serine/threonine-protein kinase